MTIIRCNLTLLLLGLLSMPGYAQKLEFTLHKLVGALPGPTLLVIGGIQGDEPGGFNAAALLVTDYKVTRGEVWVVPNLNFESIIKRSRGVYGDMNRKFLQLQSADPEYRQIQKIKSIILDPQVDMILNLHDGSGFYTPTYINRIANPDRWGQSIIIDQESLAGVRHGTLGNIAREGITQVNTKIGLPEHYYHLHDTRTWLGNPEMEKTLSYFAIRNGKSAFGVEASKEFRTHERVRFHLMVVETFMHQLGVDFTRDFEMTPQVVRSRIDGNVQLAMFDRRIFLDMTNARRHLRYIPLKRNAPLQITPSNPLIAVIDNNQALNVRYGNRHITQLGGFLTEFDDSLTRVPLVRDGELIQVALGSVVDVQHSFRVETPDQYRANVIGFRHTGGDDDSHVTIRRHEILAQYSIDKDARLFRVEIYRDSRFCGMVLLRFAADPIAVLPADRTPRAIHHADDT